MARGKNINLYLMDGKATGRIKCTLANWTGLVFKIPRMEIENSRDRDDLKQSGVYFLFGEGEEGEKNIAYIGQAGIRKNGEGVLDRLFEHKRNQEKDYWTEAVIFTTSNNSFGATEISYLESRYYEIAVKANRYEVKNLNNPNCGNITEEKESELEEYIEYSKIIMGTLGHQIFEPLISEDNCIKEKIIREEFIKEEIVKDEELTLYLNRRITRDNNRETNGICKRTNEGFVLMKGSKISLSISNHIPESMRKKREKANIENGVLKEDILFKSPSYAAVFVIGGNANGLTEWKNKDGITLKELDKREK